MRIHELKTDPQPFNHTWLGLKTFEIRSDDRGFIRGDFLLLRETMHPGPVDIEYTGREILVKITHKLEGCGLRDGWCVLSIKVIETAQSS